MEAKRVKQLIILSSFVFVAIAFVLITSLILAVSLSQTNPPPVAYAFLTINALIASGAMIVSNIGVLCVSSIIIYKQKYKKEKYHPLMEPITIMFLVASVGSIVTSGLAQAPAIGTAAGSIVWLFMILMIVTFSILVHHNKKWKKEGYSPIEPDPISNQPIQTLVMTQEPEVDDDVLVQKTKPKSKSTSKSKTKSK